MKRRELIFLFLALVVLVSCTDHSKKNIPPDNKVSIEILRFEQDLFRLPADRKDMMAGIDSLSGKYGEFLSIFNAAVLKVPDITDPLYPDVLDAYLADRSINTIRLACDSVFRNLNPFQEELSEAFSYYHMEFPEKSVPRVVTFISGLNQSFISSDSLLGIALDKYLGLNHPIYGQAFLPLYQRRSMIADRMVPDCMRAWALTEFPAGDSVRNILDHILYEGRILYFQEQLIPGIEDSLLCGFSKEQMNWCKAYENRMWTYLVEKKVIFQTDAFSIAKFVQDGPFTKDFSNESPARAAVWIGYRIVSSYMKRHPDLSLQQLMEIQNLYSLLEGSGYNP
ncbi:MAG: hypothetical protein U0T82_12135 [Bacteroidales bacterium]